MATPKLLKSIHELDEAGFVNNTEYLGDIRQTPTLLDSVLTHGVYVFDGGAESPTDPNGTYKWSLRVYPCEDCTTVEHEAERLSVETSRIVYFRSYTVNTGWTNFKSDIVTMETIGAASQNFTPTEGYHPATKQYVDEALAASSTSSKQYVDEALAAFSTIPYTISNVAPTNTNLIWIDSANGNLLKVYNTATSTWVPVNAVYS